jgi:homospermidine synthase
LYLDTCNEPWAGGYSDPTQTADARSNYAFREQALKVKSKSPKNGATALITHGANPGIVSHFVKQALLNIAKDTNTPHSVPKTRQEWAELSEKLGIKSIHIAEKDTQASRTIKHDQEFVNTWSIEGLVEEGKQPAELGWDYSH